MAATAKLDLVVVCEAENGSRSNEEAVTDGRRTSRLSIAHWLIYPVDPGLCVQRPFVKTEALLYRYIRSVLSTERSSTDVCLHPDYIHLSCIEFTTVSIIRIRYHVLETSFLAATYFALQSQVALRSKLLYLFVCI